MKKDTLEELLESARQAVQIHHGEREWISVKERLPEDGAFVLGGETGVDFVEQAVYRDGQFFVHWGRYDETEWNRFTHWMPLPPPPK
jgi:hypothetical protein